MTSFRMGHFIKKDPRETTSFPVVFLKADPRRNDVISFRPLLKNRPKQNGVVLPGPVIKKT